MPVPGVVNTPPDEAYTLLSKDAFVGVSSIFNFPSVRLESVLGVEKWLEVGLGIPSEKESKSGCDKFTLFGRKFCYQNIEDSMPLLTSLLSTYLQRLIICERTLIDAVLDSELRFSEYKLGNCKSRLTSSTSAWFAKNLHKEMTLLKNEISTCLAVMRTCLLDSLWEALYQSLAINEKNRAEGTCRRIIGYMNSILDIVPDSSPIVHRGKYVLYVYHTTCLLVQLSALCLVFKIMVRATVACSNLENDVGSLRGVVSLLFKEYQRVYDRLFDMYMKNCFDYSELYQGRIPGPTSCADTAARGCDLGAENGTQHSRRGIRSELLEGVVYLFHLNQVLTSPASFHIVICQGDMVQQGIEMYRPFSRLKRFWERFYDCVRNYLSNQSMSTCTSKNSLSNICFCRVLYERVWSSLNLIVPLIDCKLYPGGTAGNMSAGQFGKRKGNWNIVTLLFELSLLNPAFDGVLGRVDFSFSFSNERPVFVSDSENGHDVHMIEEKQYVEILLSRCLFLMKFWEMSDSYILTQIWKYFKGCKMIDHKGGHPVFDTLSSFKKSLEKECEIFPLFPMLKLFARSKKCTVLHQNVFSQSDGFSEVISQIECRGFKYLEKRSDKDQSLDRESLFNSFYDISNKSAYILFLRIFLLSLFDIGNLTYMENRKTMSEMIRLVIPIPFIGRGGSSQMHAMVVHNSKRLDRISTKFLVGIPSQRVIIENSHKSKCDVNVERRSYCSKDIEQLRTLYHHVQLLVCLFSCSHHEFRRIIVRKFVTLLDVKQSSSCIARAVVLEGAYALITIAQYGSETVPELNEWFSSLLEI